MTDLSLKVDNPFGAGADRVFKVTSAHRDKVELPSTTHMQPEQIEALIKLSHTDDHDFINKNNENRVHDWRSRVGENVASVWLKIPVGIRMAIILDAGGP